MDCAGNPGPGGSSPALGPLPRPLHPCCEVGLPRKSAASPQQTHAGTQLWLAPRGFSCVSLSKHVLGVPELSISLAWGLASRRGGRSGVLYTFSYLSSPRKQTGFAESQLSITAASVPVWSRRPARRLSCRDAPANLCAIV